MLFTRMTTIPSGPLIAVDRLSRSFPSRRGSAAVVALADVSFDVLSGEIVGVVGANGAGKTTLVDLLATTVLPTSGTARICGFDVRREAAAARRHIGYVPAGARAIYPRLTVRQNLAFFAALYGMTGPPAASRIATVLRTMQAEEVAEVRADRVSDGMIARAVLARALLHDPAVLLLDEPTRSIDPMHRPAILAAVRTCVNDGRKAAVIVTHTMDDLIETCDRVAVLREGRLASIIPVTRARARDLISRAVAGEVHV